MAIGVVFAYLLLAPGSTTLDYTEGDSSVYLAADRHIVALPGACVNVTWRTDNVNTVELNESPTVGADERRVCLTDQNEVVLKVTFPDGEQETFALEIGVLLTQAWSWALIIAAFVIVQAMFYLLQMPSGASTDHRPATVGVGWLRGVGFSLISVLVVLLVMEFGLRLYFVSAGTETDRIAYVYSREQINDLDDPIFVPLPGLGYGLSPEREDHNNLGYRNPEIEIPKPDGVFRIVAMGGSTTYGIGADIDRTYPALLEDTLHEAYGQEQVEVINAGVSGYTTFETSVAFAQRIPELEPDLVIIYHAVNDVVPRLVHPNCYRGMNAFRGLNPNRRAWRVQQAPPLSRSTLHRFFAINLGIMDNPAALEDALQEIDVPCGDTSESYTVDEMLALNPPLYFERNLRTIVAVAAANDLPVIFSTWVHKLDHDLPDGWAEGVGEHNTVTRQVADELDIPLYDLVEHFAQNPEFWVGDGIHLSEMGNAEQARLYADFIMQMGFLD